MNSNQSAFAAIAHLVGSNSARAQLLGTTILLCTFVPDVFRIIGDSSLTRWQRLEQASRAAGESLIAVVLAGVPPSAFGVKTGDELPPPPPEL